LILLDTNAPIWLQRRHPRSAIDLLDDRRWTNDDPSSTDLVQAALTIGWTRDVFDRLLVAHARLRRWRLATADAHLIEHLAPHEVLEL
jgi:PIN domain nuclease of toxin-antitoxin system